MRYRDLTERLIANSVLDVGGPLTRGTECWLWLCTKDRKKGYGKINRWSSRLQRTLSEWVHRVAYAWFHEEVIPEGIEVDHVCRNTSCINPGHFDLVTKNENVRRQGAALYGDSYDISEYTEDTRDHASNALQDA